MFDRPGTIFALDFSKSPCASTRGIGKTFCGKIIFHMNITPQSPMSAVLENFPGAQRALFRRYHIGGCSNCGFSPDETLAQVCARNGNLDVAEVLAHIQSSHEQDAKVLIS